MKIKEASHMSGDVNLQKIRDFLHLMLFLSDRQIRSEIMNSFSCVVGQGVAISALENFGVAD